MAISRRVMRRDQNLKLDLTIKSRSESDLSVKYADLSGGAKDIRAASYLMTALVWVFSREIMMTVKNSSPH
jgi:hypothetical protein